MTELYIFNQDDIFLNILTEEEGLVDTWFKDYHNHIPDESFVFNINSNSPLLQHIKEENQVAFYDRDDDLRLVRIKELYEVTTKTGHNIRVKCEPSYLELYDHFIEDKRYINKTAQDALNGALIGSRYVGEVTVELGLATDNFYWIDGIGAIFKILNTWGGALKDTITLDDENEIIERKLWIVQRLGTDNGLIVEPDYNAEQISRKTLSYIETALWGQGSSLETDNNGYTRYITFEDVEWRISAGDPVDKPKGQKWVGDPQALAENGYLHNGVRKHRFGHFSNQDYEMPEELLWATWQELQERKLKEIIHEATIYESDKKVSLGDTVTILDRNYNKPIELQSQITGLEYDVLDVEEIVIIIGKYIDMRENPLQKDVDELKEQVKKPRPTEPINNGSFPDIKPGTPVNVTATGSFQTIQLFWDYDSKVYISHYEVFGSQISDFVPDEQQLLYRGNVSAFNHEVKTDEMWYYYIRAVNTRGTVGEFSNRASASSIRVISDDILFGSITSDLLSDNLDLANRLSQSTFDDITENLNITGDVHILNGTTIIQDGVVGTAAIANLAVDRFHLNYGIIENVHIEDATIEHTKMKSLNVDHVVAGEMDLVHLRAGTIDTDKFLVRGGSAIDYAMIDGSFMELRGRYNRTWQGSTTTHDVRTRLQYGHLRFRNDALDRSLYMSEFGISTYVDGEGEGGGSSGTISWWDTRFSPSNVNGITLESYGGVAAVRSELNRALLQGASSVRLESANGSVFVSPHYNRHPSYDNTFAFTISESAQDGYLMFGSHENPYVGMRMYRGGGSNRITVVDDNYATGGNTAIEAGDGYFNTVRRRSGNLYVNLQHANIMRVGADSGGSDRIEMNAAYRWTVGSAANLHITDTGTVARSTSARKYKKDIEPITEHYAHNFFENATPVYYRPSGTMDENKNHSFYGYIADDVALFEPRMVQFGENGEPEGFNYDRTGALLHVVMKTEKLRVDNLDTDMKKIKDKVETLNLENQFLKNEIKILQEAIA